eukprot:9939018-Alexandrium_andersonii.AAC.1
MHRVNTAHFGLPQSRSRMCIVGRRRALYPNGNASGLPVFTRQMPIAKVLVPGPLLDSQPAGSGR